MQRWSSGPWASRPKVNLLLPVPLRRLVAAAPNVTSSELLLGPALGAACELTGRKGGVVRPGLPPAEAAGRAGPVGSLCAAAGVTEGAVQEGAA